MSLIADINRDYPFQVTLSLDDELIGVLDWLDARLGRWDMYVDLRDQTIRYCFRDLDDASAFSRRFVTCGRRGEQLAVIALQHGEQRHRDRDRRKYHQRHECGARHVGGAEATANGIAAGMKTANGIR